MQEYELTMAPAFRGAVLKERFRADSTDPWPRALQVLSRRVKKGDGLVPTSDRKLTLFLTPVPPTNPPRKE